ncbi:unnamed protein product [Brassicogethes aeneus]|uniref:Mitochondrial basic amino acids transporter n=1 Tax=Brassicogethes aeneus TaxID=1431903 RepID=A0A9P0B3E6_BRAAE|nr:unnamed protein product [Brassicogethes aeneus]
MALDFFAGCLGGCAGVIVGHPLDTVKVLIQTQDSKNLKYKGTLDCFKSIIRRDGLRGIYKGMSSPLAGVAGINAIVFGVYGNTQKNLSNPDSLKSHAIAGATAGLFQSCVCSPMELAKSRLQVTSSKSGPVKCLKNLYDSKGLRGVFKGLNLTIAREVPAYGAYFLTYEYLAGSNSEVTSTIDMLMAGGVAGMVSWTITYPVDVIKSRFQIDGVTNTKYTGVFDCLKKSVQSEGISILFRGLTPTIARAFPVNAVTFTVVTWTIRLMKDESVQEKFQISNNSNYKYTFNIVDNNGYSERVSQYFTPMVYE